MDPKGARAGPTAAPSADADILLTDNTKDFRRQWMADILTTLESIAGKYAADAIRKVATDSTPPSDDRGA